MSLTQQFAAALLVHGSGCPPGLTAWNGSDPAQRFAVYRNNVMVSLTDALAETYPVIQALVGEEFFRAMARLFIVANLPRTPVLAWYGEGFSEFVRTFPPACALPYLADMANLEMARVRAYHAADLEPLAVDALGMLLADAQRLPDARLALHPSLYAFRSKYAVVSLWAAHQTDNQAADPIAKHGNTVETALATVDPMLAEAGLVMRSGLNVATLPITQGAAEFIASLSRGLPFGEAATCAFAVDAAFDLATTLGQLIQAGAIVAAEVPTSHRRPD